MQVVRKISELRALREKLGGTVGFVPTMGYLHKGHMSLVKQALAENPVVIVSIYVNPTQFGPKEDFGAYPRDLSRDLELLREAGVDFVFVPSDEELFSIVRPSRAYFGQKDAQQVIVIKRMVVDLDMGIEIVAVPTLRESDGLAMSSRNTYLSSEERQAATVLFKALSLARQLTRDGEKDAERIRGQMISIIQKEPLASIDYVSITRADTLRELDLIESPALASLAVRIGRTRLIDNMVLE
jgi:pantoate--beta-alanine ligase